MATFEFRVDNVLTDATSVKFSSPAGTYGLRRVDTAEIIIADNVAWTHDGTGLYSYDVDSLLDEGVTYDYYIEVVYDGETTYVQRFLTAEGELDSIGLRFVVIQEGEAVAADQAPVLSNPTGTFGVVRTDTGETVAADSTAFTASGTLYAASFGEPEANLTYRYYVEAEVDGVTYYLPRTTSWIRSSALVLGRYTDSTKIERRYGVENVHKWLGVDEGDEAVDYGLRFYDHIAGAETELDDLLRGWTTVPFSGVPSAIADIATDLAANRAYEARGVVDMDAESGQPMHRLASYYKRAMEKIAKIKSGEMRLESDTLIRYPRSVETELETFADTTPELWSEWTD